MKINGSGPFNFGAPKIYSPGRMEPEWEEAEDTCRACGQFLAVEHLVVTECDDILCQGCLSHHDCSICGSETEDSDSDYEPSEDECLTTEPSELPDESSGSEEPA